MAEQQASNEKIVAVFSDERAAQAAAEAARRQGVEAGAIHIGSALDERHALQAEMREEMEHTTVGAGNIGPFTKEMTKGLSFGVAVGAVVGVVLALPAAFLFFTEEQLFVRLVIAVFVGAAAGATVGFVAGGGLAAKGPVEQLAAERGTALSIIGGGQAVVDILRRYQPIRLDLVRDDQPVDTIATEEARVDDNALDRLRDNVVRGEPEGDWSPLRADEDQRR